MGHPPSPVMTWNKRSSGMTFSKAAAPARGKRVKKPQCGTGIAIISSHHCYMLAWGVLLQEYSPSLIRACHFAHLPMFAAQLCIGPAHICDHSLLKGISIRASSTVRHCPYLDVLVSGFDLQQQFVGGASQRGSPDDATGVSLKERGLGCMCTSENDEPSGASSVLTFPMPLCIDHGDTQRQGHASWSVLMETNHFTLPRGRISVPCNVLCSTSGYMSQQKNLHIRI